MLGAPVEGAVEVPDGFVDTVDVGRGRYTDDTAMTLGVARSLAGRGRFDGEHMARTLAGIHDAEPWRGYGAGPPRIFRRLAEGAAWDEPARELYGGQGSFGNGAAMRVAPVAVFARPDLSRVAEVAAHTASITHTHPEGVDGAVLQALAVAVLLDQPDDVDPERLMARISPHLTTATFAAVARTLPTVVAGADDDAARRSLGNGIEARRSVPTALYCVAAHPGSFHDAVAAAVGMGGDADTIGAMAGALAGARFGLSGIPAPWRRVEGAAELTDLADRLGPAR